MCNIVHTCIKKYTVAVLYSCKFCTARVFLFLADHEAIQFTNILKIRRYLCADEAKGLLVPYVLVAVRREWCRKLHYLGTTSEEPRAIFVRP